MCYNFLPTPAFCSSNSLFYSYTQLKRTSCLTVRETGTKGVIGPILSRGVSRNPGVPDAGLDSREIVWHCSWGPGRPGFKS